MTTTETAAATTADYCFNEAAQALGNDKCELGREWRQLGEAISAHVERHTDLAGRHVDRG